MFIYAWTGTASIDGAILTLETKGGNDEDSSLIPAIAASIVPAFMI